MSRRANRENSGEASLFPFLAVLLCTMGALVTLLVVMATVSRQMAEREQAEAAQAVEPARAARDHRLEKGLADRAIELAAVEQQLTERQREVADRLAREQAIMQSTEDSLTRLHEQYLALREVARELEAMESEHLDDREQAERELARLQQLAVEYRRKIDEAMANATAPKSFAVVPYEGPNGTNRRPVYIECRGDKVVLQPEGIELMPADFNLAMGADSALASAVRAAQRYYDSETEDPRDQPYPLILVRPDGVHSYMFVRDVLESWDSDFGYELVDADWNLDFGLADPVLAERKQLAVMQARARQQALAAAAPGIVQDGTVSSFQPPSRSSRAASAGGASPGGPLLSGFGINGAGMGGDGAGIADTEFAAQANSDRDGKSSAANGNSTDQSESLSADGQGQRAGNEQLTASDGQGSSSVQHSGDTRTMPDQAVEGTNATADDGVPQVARSAAPSQLASSANAGESTGTAQSANPGSGASTAASGSPASPSVSVSAGSQANADRTGGQGSSDNASATAFAVVRPIRIVATSGSLVVVPDGVRDLRSLPPAIVDSAVPVSTNQVEMLTELRDQMQRHITGWGMAGAGLRWKPRIELMVLPGGEAAAAVVTRAARESGIEISSGAAAQNQGGSDATTSRR